MKNTLFNLFLRSMSAANVWVYRLTDGKIGGKFSKEAAVCLITVKGRKTGKERTIPLLYINDDKNVIIVASKGGYPSHPTWYLNLVQNPTCLVQRGKEKQKMIARTATPDEKMALWPKMVAIWSSYKNYQEKTEREIPVVILEPLS